MQRGKQLKGTRSAGRSVAHLATEPFENQPQQQQQALYVVSPRIKPKQSKLLNSKSLSQLMSRGLFFKRSKDKDAHRLTNGQQNGHKLTTTRSLPNVEPAYVNALAMSAVETTPQPQLVSDVRSVSLNVLGRHSSCNYFTNSTTLEEPSLSPIIAAARDAPSFSFSDSSSRGSASNVEQSNKPETKVVESQRDTNEPLSGDVDKKKGGKYKPLKNTALVLRDVKNSIGLRLKAKQASQAFSKLSNELATPPTKLYSPFNIYTPDECKKSTISAGKSKRKLNLNNNKGNRNKPIGSDCSMMEVDDNETVESPKGRFALQHKKHLMQEAAAASKNNRFAFDSPTGKLRETVKDVERFQQCIEDISKTIRSRRINH